MPTIVTRGSASAKALGFGASQAAPVYVEDVFSTYLYTGNGSTQTITNNIDLSTKGGMVWIKYRNVAAGSCIFDTIRGANNYLRSSDTNQSFPGIPSLTAFNTDGFSLGNGGIAFRVNAPNGLFTSWSFRKQTKFFDVVQFTTDANGGGTFSHSLGSVPGMAIVKSIDAAGAWNVYHKSLPTNYWIQLQSTNAAFDGGGPFATFTATTGTIPNFNLSPNANYIVYMFADQAGGFGLTGSDSVVACGSFTTDASGASSLVNLGWEPQFLLFKRYNVSAGGPQDNWQIVDIMRGLNGGPAVPNEPVLFPNTTDAEYAWPVVSISATGFQTTNQGYVASNSSFIYIAIRRGPMKVPTSGTSIYNAYSAASSGSINFDSQAYYYDLGIIQNKDGSYGATWADRLRGIGAANTSGTVTTTATSLVSSGSAAESTSSNLVQSASGGFTSGSSAGNRVFWLLRRAPGFFDEVCYTGTGSARTVAHNLGVAPELMIVKARNTSSYNWTVYGAPLPAPSTNALILNATLAGIGPDTTFWNSTSPTANAFTVGTNSFVNNSGNTYVAYLFATCPGVSKVGSYTGTGAAQNINCGFSAGARFVLIKRTDSTGDWYVYDSARGVSSGNDPYLLLNSTAAEVTGTNYVDSYSSGFTLTSTAPAGLNASGGAYIYLAIA